MESAIQDIPTLFVGQPGTEQGSANNPLRDVQVYLMPSTREGSLGRLGHYEVLEVLGRGGFGIVVKAFDETLQRLVAIKILAPHLAITSPPRKFFLREARSAAKVRHENVVQIYAVDEQPLPYLVMEYIEGRTLQQRLDEAGPFDPMEVIRIGRQIALGLAAAHERGLIHRDIKPANILLEKGDSPNVKITDFGIARTVDDASMTQSGVVVGTPMYMAPEQANGETVDLRADLFSLGSVLYTMVCGRPPFRAPSSMAVLKRVTEDTPRPIAEVNPAVPAGLCAVIARLNAKAPSERFASASAVAQALEQCLTVHSTMPSSNTRSGFRRSAAVILAPVVAAALGFAANNYARQSDEWPRVEPQAHSPLSVNVNLRVPEKIEPELLPWMAWEKSVLAMPADQQISAVTAKLLALNPGLEEMDVTSQISDGSVISLSVRSNHLGNIVPVRVLRGLRELRFESKNLISPLKDISPLRGLKLDNLSIFNSNIVDLAPLAGMPLKQLTVWDFKGHDLTPLQGMPLTSLNCGGSPVRDLSPLRGMALTFLCVNMSLVSDLSPLEGMPLGELLMERTQVSDLRPVLTMPLKVLRVQGSPIASLEILRDLPLRKLSFEYKPSRDRDLLRTLTKLEEINLRPAADFFKN